IFLGGWLGWQLLRQNGRLLLRLDALEEFVNDLELGKPGAPTGLPIGSPAPDFELPDLAGERKTLAQYRGQSVLVVFFNPACGFCREMTPRLSALASGTGSTGHWSVPPGDPPGGTTAAFKNEKEIQKVGTSVSFGGSPNETGGSPVLPFILIITTGD